MQHRRTQNPLRLWAAVVLPLTMVGVPPTAAVSEEHSPNPPAVVRQLFSVTAPCAGDSSCIVRAIDGWTTRLGARVRRMPHGSDGLTSWIRLAAELHGTAPRRVPAPDHRPLGDAVIDLYREVHLELSASLVDDVTAQTRRLSAHARDEIAGLVDALVLATRLTNEATRNTALDDPADAFRLAGAVAHDAAPREVRERWRRVLARLGRVDLPKIVAAALVIAEAVADYDHVYGQSLELPLVSVGGAGNTTHSEDLVLLIDESGNDTYLNNAGGPLYVLPAGPGGAPTPGLAWDMGTGRDHYRRGRMGQGFGIGAPGILLDEGGRDLYEANEFGQGASSAGVGVLYDAGADADRYLSPSIKDRTRTGTGSPIGTKASSLAGIGMLVDEGGADVYHQDRLDGLIYGAAGGLGLLASLGPERDLYRSRAKPAVILDQRETFLGPIEVSAEIAGAAILYEEGGNDRYECIGPVRQGCQAASGDDSLALLWDRGGNDVYSMDRSISVDIVREVLGLHPTAIDHPIFPMGQGAGYGGGVPSGGSSLGVLKDEEGDDVYRAEKWAQGYGTLGGIGVLHDSGGGVDRYKTVGAFNGRRADDSRWIDGVVGIGVDE